MFVRQYFCFSRTKWITWLGYNFFFGLLGLFLVFHDFSFIFAFLFAHAVHKHTHPIGKCKFLQIHIHTQTLRYSCTLTHTVTLTKQIHPLIKTIEILCCFFVYSMYMAISRLEKKLPLLLFL